MRVPAISLVLVLAVNACSSPPPAEAADRDATLTQYLGIDPLTERGSDPLYARSFAHYFVVALVYENLLRFDDKTLRPAPAAADLPLVSSDGLTYTFRIRPGQTYSDGAPLNAHDFAYALGRFCDPAEEAGYAAVLFVVTGCEEWHTLDHATESPRTLKAARDLLFARGLHAVNDLELRVGLDRPAAWLPSFLALWVSAPVRERDVRRRADWWLDPSAYVGNGPFVLTEHLPGDRLVFVANPRARVTPKLKGWTMRLFPSGLEQGTGWVAAAGAFRAGGIDVVDGEILGGLAADGGIDKDPQLAGAERRAAPTCTDWVRFNGSRAPFDDANLRRAMAKSVDRDAYLSRFDPSAKPALSLIPPTLPGHDPQDTEQTFDPTAARRLMAQSGYASTPFPRTIWPVRGPGQKIRAEWIAAQWKALLGIGIEPQVIVGAELRTLNERPDTVSRLRFADWCPDYPDQQNWLSTLFHSRSGFQRTKCDPGTAVCAFYVSREFDLLVEQADAEPDRSKRDSRYLEASRRLSNDAAVVWLGHWGLFKLVKPWVRGFGDGFGFSPADVYVIKHSR